MSSAEGATDDAPKEGAGRRFVRRCPWVMFVPGFLLTVPAAYLIFTLMWFVVLVVPPLMILFLIVGPPWLGLGLGWRRRSRPRLWFGGGYTLGMGLVVAQVTGLGRFAPWLY